MEQKMYCEFGLTGYVDSSGKIDIESVDILPIHDERGNLIGHAVPTTIENGKIEFKGHVTLSGMQKASIALDKISFSVEGNLKRRT